MSIDRVNIQTPSFTLRATHIRGGQLQNLLAALRQSGAAASAGATNGLGAAPAGPGAMQSPAQRFPQLGEPPSAGASDPTAGFAGGGQDALRSLDSNAFMQMIMALLGQLLQALFQMLGQGNSFGAGDPAGQGPGCGGGSGASGGPATCGGNGLPVPAPPTTGGGSSPVPIRPATAADPQGANGHGACGDAAGSTRARPRRKSSAVRRILGQIGRGAAAAAPLVPGGGVARAGLSIAKSIGGGERSDRQASIPRSLPASRTFPVTSSALRGGSIGGESLEDRLFHFLSSKVRESEQELDGAMQQGAGGSGGDSRSIVTQQVQQLAQKRSELVETLTNTLKTLHDSTMAVSKNLN